MLQEEFKKNGIEFAHRNVTVYLPPGSAEEGGEEGSEGRKQKALEAGAAAALAAEDAAAAEQPRPAKGKSE